MGGFSVKELAQVLGANTAAVQDFFDSVSTDSRNIKQGQCFFAIKGQNFDGHDYVADALKKGAVCAVVEKNYNCSCELEPRLIRVQDTTESLGLFAAHHRKKCGFKVVAITGSVGKTTTRRIIAHVLGQHFRVITSPKNFNNHIGLPLTLLSAKPEDEIVIAELGTNHPGEIAYLSRIAQPDIAMVTAIAPAHLEGFGCIEKILIEKLSITQGLTQNGTLIINGDCKHLADTCRDKKIPFESFGTSPDCDAPAANINCGPLSSEFYIDDVRVTVGLCGKGNLENTLAAWAVCKKFGLSAAAFAKAVKTMPLVSMRSEIKQFGTLTVIDDCYNANPASMKNAIDILSKLSESKNARSVFICGDMAELGGSSEQLHKELGDYIAKSNIKLILTAGPMSHTAAQTAKNNAAYKIEYQKFDNVDFLCDNLHKFVKDYDIVLVKGSRSAALEKAVEKLRLLFDKSHMAGVKVN
ncbi:MAG: UDP-N-acetylmuramoyl-tripeptide--D-alanyl-D-alanine ligase [Phycisphaerae bacterium]